MAANFPTSNPSFTKKDYVNRETPLVADYNKALEEIESIGTWLRGDTVPKSTTANLTFYVNPSTGNDNNNGSSGSPFKTIAKAVSMIPQIVNHEVRIYLADGSYSEGITLRGYVGGGEIFILGNIDYPENVVIAGRIFAIRCTIGFIVLYGMETTNTGSESIRIDRNPGAVFLDKLVATNSTSTYAALYVVYSPSVYIQESTLSNHKFGIYTAGAARVFSYNNSGSNNTTGLYASAATIMKGGTQPGGTTGESASEGGVIR